MKTYIKLHAPFEWVNVDGKKVDAFGEVPSLDDYPLSDANELIGVVPGEWVTVHKVSIPAKSKKQFLAALPYALEEVISDDIEDTHFVCPAWKSGEEVKVLVISKDRMREWQTLSNKHRLPIEQLIPDYALVPFHDAAEYSLAKSGQQLLTNNQTDFGTTIDPEFVDLWLLDIPMASTIAVNDQELAEQLIENNPDRDIRHWPFGSKMAHWLEYVSESKIDLWADVFRPSVRTTNFRVFILPLLIMCLALLIKIGFDTYRYLALHSEIKTINFEMQKVVKSAFPQIDIVPEDSELAIMQQAISRYGGEVETLNVQTMLAEVSAVMRRQGVSIASVTYRDQRLEIICQLKDFSQVDQITTQLNKRSLIRASLQSSSADEGEIVASYIIRQS